MQLTHASEEEWYVSALNGVKVFFAKEGCTTIVTNISLVRT